MLRKVAKFAAFCAAVIVLDHLNVLPIVATLAYWVDLH